MKKVRWYQRKLDWFLGLSLVLFALSLSPALAQSTPLETKIAIDHHRLRQQTPSFETAPCMFEFTVAFISPEDADIDCGYVTVPERHSDPGGPTIRLAVAILRSVSQSPALDPLVMAQGGPGGSTIEFAEILINSPLRADRDIILFDQRGTLHSEPNLACPEILTYTVETLAQHLTPEEDLAQSSQALLECRERLVDEGVNLAAYNSVENAADINDLRIALGYEQINLYGISYGTLLALHTMRDYPAALRSVILDAVVPPQTNFLVEISGTMDRAFTELFEACAADAGCRADYPDLEQRFFDLVTQLNENPITIPLTDPETEETYQALLDGDDLVGVMFQYLYQTDFIPTLPKLIDDMGQGEYAFLSNTLPLFLFDRTFSLGMYQSVMCAEDADFGPDDLPTEDIRPQILDNAAAQNESFLELCADWGVPALGSSIDEPVVSDIPTLLFSGQFDPITPPPYAARAAQTLSRSYSYTFPVNGHGAALPGDFCTNQIIRAFLNNPTLEPNGSCIASLPSIPAFLPASTITVGLVGAVATSPNKTHLVQFSLAGLSLLGLLSAWVVWPIVLVVYWFRYRTLPQYSCLTWLSYALVILIGLLGIIFIAGLFGVLILTIANSQNLSLLLVGVPGQAAPLFVLPPLLILLTVGLVVATIMVWISRSGSIWGRLYYTLLLIFAVIYSVVLVAWGMLGVLV